MFRYQTKTRFVEAVRVTKQTIVEASQWYGDTISNEDIGKYLVKQDNNEFYWYTVEDFDKQFIPAPEKSNVITTKDVGLKRAKIAAKSEF